MSHFEYLVWVDVETTGLKQADRLLEVAAVVTEMSPEFTQVGEPFHRVLGLGDLKLQDIDANVLSMHTANGLWQAAQKSRMSRDQAMSDLRRWFAFSPQEAAFHWAGRNVYFDLQWLTGARGANLEQVREFSHRRFDVTPIKALMSLAGLSVPVEEDAHRALQDILGDIELARQIVRTLRVVSP